MIIDQREASREKSTTPKILQKYRYKIRGQYQFMRPGLRTMCSETEFNEIKDATNLECFKIFYRSDGLRIVGYIVKPKEIIKPLPLIIYNRGGNRNYGRIMRGILIYLHQLAKAGFVVMASNYRGAAGSAGRDEFGGHDLNDVLNLFAIAATLNYVDMKNIFMLGYSRGGIMTYQAIKAGAPIRAAAVVGAPTDIKEDDAQRPEMMRIYRNLWPDFNAPDDAAFKRRSAYYWAEEINVPILIMHGNYDDRVAVTQATKMAARLQSLGKDCKLIIAEDDHSLTNDRPQRDRQIIEWFNKYLLK